ncbi:alkaline phosphatase-like isoform X1 [Scylla paramamosain]|uniref:alkaline phosphatase-like isoform X1 n=1 Tax=Scylla paramamosain TaxID=85552 RepID=UPI003083B58A
MRCVAWAAVAVLVVVVGVAEGQGNRPTKDRAGDEDYHRKRKMQYKKAKKGSSYDTVPFIDPEDQAYWNTKGQEALERQLQVRPQLRKAKNIILFLGDGMSISTVTAARILKGQYSGLWEKEELVWETFPYSAIIKTYTTDSQVADSAASANAYLSGVKSNKGTLGVDVNVDLGNCSAQLDDAFHLSSLASWFQDAGRSTGFVTTTRVTHATPAALYAHVADREWEDDQEVRRDGEDPDRCDDIAEQLILSDTGKRFKVVMGGGRRNLLPKAVTDVVENKKGYRNDGKNLIDMWQRQKASSGSRAAYVWNRQDLLGLDTSNTDYLLGLFGYSHMDYSIERDNTQDPSLPEMTKAALEILQRDAGGYFLLVEGGLIDLGHHGNKGKKALTETLEMDEAVKVVLSMVNLQETLVVVTADHGHSLSINGYPSRHTDILGVAEVSGEDYLPYSTLLYGNGPGYRTHIPGHRPDPSRQDMGGVNYRQDAAVPLRSAAHSGDDVGLWATGPHAHLFTGVYEQNYIAHALAYAACVGHGRTFCGGGVRRNRGVETCRGQRRWHRQRC